MVKMKLSVIIEDLSNGKRYIFSAEQMQRDINFDISDKKAELINLSKTFPEMDNKFTDVMVLGNLQLIEDGI